MSAEESKKWCSVIVGLFRVKIIPNISIINISQQFTTKRVLTKAIQFRFFLTVKLFISKFVSVTAPKVKCGLKIKIKHFQYMEEIMFAFSLSAQASRREGSFPANSAVN